MIVPPSVPVKANYSEPAASSSRTSGSAGRLAIVQLSRCADGRARWWLSGDVAVLPRCTSCELITCLQIAVSACWEAAHLARRRTASNRGVPLPTAANGTLMARRELAAGIVTVAEESPDWGHGAAPTTGPGLGQAALIRSVEAWPVTPSAAIGDSAGRHRPSRRGRAASRPRSRPAPCIRPCRAQWDVLPGSLWATSWPGPLSQRCGTVT